MHDTAGTEMPIASPSPHELGSGKAHGVHRSGTGPPSGVGVAAHRQSTTALIVASRGMSTHHRGACMTRRSRPAPSPDNGGRSERVWSQDPPIHGRGQLIDSDGTLRIVGLRIVTGGRVTGFGATTARSIIPLGGSWRRSLHPACRRSAGRRGWRRGRRRLARPGSGCRVADSGHFPRRTGWHPSPHRAGRGSPAIARISPPGADATALSKRWTGVTFVPGPPREPR